VILMVHGTPTWSFMYRHLIAGLAPHFRCIAPDHIGFGLSERPQPYTLTLADHVRNLEALVEHLGLRDIALMVHDFGGPIGLGYALEHPNNVRALAITNTWLWSFDPASSQYRTLRTMGGPIGRFLYTRMNFSPRTILPAAWGDKSRFSKQIHRQYTAAFPTPASRATTHRFAQLTLESGAWLDQQWAHRDRIAAKPALLAWGLKDPAFGTAFARWSDLFPYAKTVLYPEVGHFVPDERGPELVPLMREFLNGSPTTDH
jgi:pimeloyl-ACP methyl ester carboxylesterase